MRRAALLAFALGVGFAGAEEIDIFVDKTQAAGSLSRVVEPAYPKALLAAGKGGHVDITGTVSPVGELQDVTYTPDSPSSQAFVEALREVVPYWKFDSDIDDECRPKAQNITTRMFFEVVDGKPKVSVTHAARPTPRPESRPLKRVKAEYPRRALAAGHESVVYASGDITPAGAVESAQAWAYPQHMSGTLFKDAVRYSLMQWEFRPATTDRKRRVCVVQEFKLVN